MTSTFMLLNLVIAGAICLRLILFRREGGTHRPLASLLAYLLTVSSGAMAIAILLLCLVPETTLYAVEMLLAAIGHAQTVLNLVLCVAILAVRGNVVDLFRPTSDNRQSFILRLLRREKWI